MPIIASFYGITIRMYFRQSEHNPPHVHALYGGSTAEIAIKDGEVLDGQLPPKALSMVKQWVAKNRDDLMKIWSTQEFKRLEPLEM